MYIYFNGKFVDEGEAKVSVRTHALQYGTGCFEGIRAYYNEKQKALFVFRLEDHFKRLINSGKILFMDSVHTVEEFCKLTVELLRKNYVPQDIYIRPFFYKSDELVGNFDLKKLQTGFSMYCIPMGRYLATDEGIRANISSWRRISDNAIPPRAKITGSYVNTALAKTESLHLGFGECLLLDHNNHIVEGSAENVFIVRDGTLITPPVSDDILVGITRSTILTLAKNDLDIPFTERSIDRTEVYSADEVFVVGTGAEVTPIVEVDGRPIGTGKVGSVGKKIKDTYFTLVHGEYPKYKEWVTKITKNY